MPGNEAGLSLEDRLWKRVSKSEDGCWNWTGHVSGGGYGRIRNGGKREQAHRVSFALAGNKIPEGLVVDHICNNRRCVRPDHLQAITQRDNILRSDSPPARQSKQVACLNGHPLDGDNLFMRRNGKRECRVCIRARGRKRLQDPVIRERRNAQKREAYRLKVGGESNRWDRTTP